MTVVIDSFHSLILISLKKSIICRVPDSISLCYLFISVHLNFSLQSSQKFTKVFLCCQYNLSSLHVLKFIVGVSLAIAVTADVLIISMYQPILTVSAYWPQNIGCISVKPIVLSHVIIWDRSLNLLNFCVSVRLGGNLVWGPIMDQRKQDKFKIL